MKIGSRLVYVKNQWIPILMDKTLQLEIGYIPKRKKILSQLK